MTPTLELAYSWSNYSSATLRTWMNTVTHSHIEEELYRKIVREAAKVVSAARERTYDTSKLRR